MASTYNLAFPALLYPGLTNKKTKINNYWPLTPPKFPDYLKLTFYGDLAIEQYSLKQSGEIHKLEITTDTDKELIDLDLRLPTFWNSMDKSKNCEIGSNGLDLKYIGPGKQELHAALARTNFPMRQQCGLFYFEIHIQSKGEDGFVGIGFCRAENNLGRLPGWDANSWGYHGDDGHSFAGTGVGQDYGPSFSTGDVIGCGVNFADNSAFYTKNGKNLGTAFRGIDTTKPLYPSVGLRTIGEKVTANFGHEPFVYDIEYHINEQKNSIFQEIMFKEANTAIFSSNQLVISYLIHHGYTKTASALVKNSKGLSSLYADRGGLIGCGDGIEQRTSIRTAIVNGRIDEAIGLIEHHFPSLLEEQGKSTLLLLKCGKFIEMMREYSEYAQSEGCHCEESTIDRSRPTRRRLSYAEITSHPKNTQFDFTEKVASEKKAHMVDIVEFDEPTSHKDNSASFLEQVMKYGQQIQEEYKLDHSEKTKESLMEIFSLLAYPDPYNSPVAHIMSVSRRDALATEVNTAILAFLNQPETPAASSFS